MSDPPAESQAEVPLQAWIAAEKARLDAFATWWIAEQSGELAAMFPGVMPLGEWDEQYRSWTGG